MHMQVDWLFDRVYIHVVLCMLLQCMLNIIGYQQSAGFQTGVN